MKVPALNTSRRCSVCGFITPGNRESQDRFVCKAPGCGHAENADTNAARNIAHAAKQEAPQDIVGARMWSPRGYPGDEASTTSSGRVPLAGFSRLWAGEDVKFLTYTGETPGGWVNDAARAGKWGEWHGRRRGGRGGGSVLGGSPRLWNPMLVRTTIPTTITALFQRRGGVGQACAARRRPADRSGGHQSGYWRGTR
ncbi:zinc ribbon domain-containing protein [Allosalinactinospora lopnorensis]|uniref:zinc ribbon domain-containing protein n=1 Tax=Allosalinactinospora lopnorensis TaxID=1352348 RepID=UPI00373FD831